MKENYTSTIELLEEKIKYVKHHLKWWFRVRTICFFTDFLSDMNEWLNAIARSIETYYASIKPNGIPVEFITKVNSVFLS